jgi:Na+/proline symporter
MEKIPSLSGTDWCVIILFFICTLIIGLYFSKRATSSLSDYFVAGRKMSWWLAGTSIVATSFASDTPLVLAGWMRTVGLERNWFWWGGIMGMMLCTFFFARLWRRAGILTDVEFNELRYSGKPAMGLRIFHASYRSLIQNTLVMGWVTLAMVKILDVTLNIPASEFVLPFAGSVVIPAKVTGIVICLLFAAFYSSLSGLWGIMATDFFQFALAMFATILFMFLILFRVGGPGAMVSKAQKAVNQGIVINKAYEQRKETIPVKALFRSETPQRFIARETAKLKDSGIMTPSPSESELLWDQKNRTEQEIRYLLDQADSKISEPVLTHWKKTFAVSTIQFTDFKPVEQMLAAGILFHDTAETGEKLDYYRLSRSCLNESELQKCLVHAAIENKSEILAAYRGDRVVPPLKITSFLPPFDLKGGGLLAVWSLIVFLGLQWWQGGEGGGFLAQRLFSCKNERHSVMAMLWFNLAHFVIRPWPWIVIGIASLFMIPDITAYSDNYDQEYAYVVMFMRYLPNGLKGLMVAALMAAYMSTISTHINFGASYIMNDLYRRFFYSSGSERHYVRISQLVSFFLAFLAGGYAYFSNSISDSWFVMFELMSGVGVVLLLRWYWWRINAWSELSAMAASLLMYALLNWTGVFQFLFELAGLPGHLISEYAVRFTLNLICSSFLWISVTLLTSPESEEQLIRFYRQVRPGGWWNAISAKSGISDYLKVGRIEWLCWGLGVTGLLSMIVCIGKMCLGLYFQSLVFGLYSIVAVIFVFTLLSKMDWSDIRH